MNIAVFGGSFDPPHKGHLAIIKEALKELDIDQIFIVPTYLNPFKKKFFYDEKQRFKLVSDMVKNIKKAKVLDFEIKQKRAVRTIETIEYIKKSMKDIKKIYLIIGADNLKDLNKWHKIEELKKSVEIVVATRNNINIPKEYKKLSINENISSTQIRREIEQSRRDS